MFPDLRRPDPVGSPDCLGLPVSVAQDETDHYAKQEGNRKDGQEGLFMMSYEMPHHARTLFWRGTLRRTRGGNAGNHTNVQEASKGTLDQATSCDLLPRGCQCGREQGPPCCFGRNGSDGRGSMLHRKALAKRLNGAGPLEPITIDALARMLVETLPPA